MNQTNTVSAPRTKTYEITMTALMAAVTCILAPLSIPIGPVPISFTNLAIYLSLYLLGWKKGTISYLIYLLLGLVGLPVFSGFTGGPAKLAGPTGGYIIGFIVMAVEKEGYLRVAPVGGVSWDVSKTRHISFGNGVQGVIVKQPTHESGEGMQYMFVDIGAADEAELQAITRAVLERLKNLK